MKSLIFLLLLSSCASYDKSKKCNDYKSEPTCVLGGMKKCYTTEDGCRACDCVNEDWKNNSKQNPSVPKYNQSNY
jgi:hypothetical protein